MNIKKILSCAAAAAIAASVMSVSAYATNWANASYADNDPNTVNVISVDESKAEFTATADGSAAKLRITVGELLEDSEIAKIKSATWKVTYTIPEGTPAGNGVGGGTWFGVGNSDSYWISPDSDADGNACWSNTTYTVDDGVKFLLPTEVLSADSELVFMDWSSHEAITKMTVAISDLKFFDADGNELAQKAFASAAPAADANTTSTATGNTAAAVIASVMALAGAAAIASRKNK